jgi:hypothetical protein
MGNVTVSIGSGLIGVAIASMSGHRLGPLTDEQDRLPATTPGDQFLKDELRGPCGAAYRRMIGSPPVGRAGTPDEVADVEAPFVGRDGGYISGSDPLNDGGVTSSYRFGDLAL